MADDAKTKFNATRLGLMDTLRRDHDQPMAARIVGMELMASLNSVSGQSWKSEATLKRELGFNLKTIKRAIQSLENRYFKISRIKGLVNVYTPIWSASKAESTRGAGGLDTRGAAGPGTRGAGGPVSPSRLSPSRLSPSRVEIGPDVISREAVDCQDKKNAGFTARRDDGAIELQAIELFNRAGLDGLGIVSSLHEIDNGLPRLRLFRLIRGGAVTGNDLKAAALAATEHDNRKTTLRPALRRSRGGAA
jgi:hypothetical protein